MSRVVSDMKKHRPCCARGRTRCHADTISVSRIMCIRESPLRVFALFYSRLREDDSFAGTDDSGRCAKSPSAKRSGRCGGRSLYRRDAIFDRES